MGADAVWVACQFGVAVGNGVAVLITTGVADGRGEGEMGTAVDVGAGFGVNEGSVVGVAVAVGDGMDAASADS